MMLSTMAPLQLLLKIRKTGREIMDLPAFCWQNNCAANLWRSLILTISDPYLHVMHVHSGETHHVSTTKADKIHLYANCARTMGENVIIFTTYNSLHRIVEADIEVNTIYFDEAHNSVKKNFFPATEFFAENADRCYFYTATPKHSLTVNKPGMNWGCLWSSSRECSCS